jgi:tetrahydromethanopterin S-methyltransferase subunit B
MEEKEKIQLKDGTEYQIETGVTENRIDIVFSSMEEFNKAFDKLTPSNLSQFRILTASDVVCSVFIDKKLSKIQIETTDKGIKASFILANVDPVEKMIIELRETVDQLVLTSKTV